MCVQCIYSRPNCAELNVLFTFSYKNSTQIRCQTLLNDSRISLDNYYFIETEQTLARILLIAAIQSCAKNWKPDQTPKFPASDQGPTCIPLVHYLHYFLIRLERRFKIQQTSIYFEKVKSEGRYVLNAI